MITPDMILGRSVLAGDSILIREGMSNLVTYRERLRTLGIFSVYIEDAASEGIEIEDVISEKLHSRCKDTLSTTMKQLRKQAVVDNSQVEDLVGNLLDELLSKPHMLVSMSDIGRTADNTLEHSINTTIYASFLGMKLGYTRKQLATLAEGTLLHDLGKTILDNKILFKPGKLTPDELEYVQTHTTLGYEQLAKTSQLPEYAKQIALCHHERLDGTGYPKGLKGNQIVDEVRIASIVDVYEALTADRCYRMALSPIKAIDILYQDAVSKLDFELVTTFVQNLAAYPNGTLVNLSDGSRGIVKAQNPSMPLRPIIRIIKQEGAIDVPIHDVDLMEHLNLTIVDD